MTRHRVQVDTNDPLRPRLDLSISGEVREFARIDPRYVTPAGKAGTGVKATVTITPVHRFKVREVRAQEGKNMRATVQETRSAGEAVFIVMIENILDTPGGYTDTVIVETDSPIKPEITIGVRGEIL